MVKKKFGNDVVSSFISMSSKSCQPLESMTCFIITSGVKYIIQKPKACGVYNGSVGN